MNLQEKFWQGEFGDKYTDRNVNLVSTNLAMFAKILDKTRNVKSVMEFGANTGLNLQAIKLLKNVSLSGVEINEKACKELEKIATAYNSSIVDFNGDFNSKVNKQINRYITYDFVLMKGILIHINPKDLERVYQKAFELSNKYICIAEYYNPKPTQIEYRGNKDKLFKRDFAGEMMDRFTLKLVDYGFSYHRDLNFPQDDITWFLLEK